MEDTEQDAFMLDFSCDPLKMILGQGEYVLNLRPKTLAVLRHLVRRAGRIVSRQELLDAVWGDTKVNEAALKVCVREIRTALKDDAAAPRFIETLPRQGYRFIAPLSGALSVPSSETRVLSSLPTPDTQHPIPLLVGRETELAQLHAWLEKALLGERQVIFVTGEPGIGKTTLVEAFLAQIAMDKRWVVARGQCEEHYGSSEAYMPVLQAVEQLCRGPERQRLVTLLRQHAPTWIVQMPSLLSSAEREVLGRELLGSTRTRMLREAANAVEVLTAKRGLVLVLEDLHWSDHSTVELISFLARQRGLARLLLIGAYRPEDLLSREHPLHIAKHELQSHGQCQELGLQPLAKDDVAAYLGRRFPGAALPAELVQAVHQRTEGNPLFLFTIVKQLTEQGIGVRHEQQWVVTCERSVAALGLPASIQQLIEGQLARVAPRTQEILEAASVAGASFSTASVAAGLGIPREEVEQVCETLARSGRFIRDKGLAEWLDGTAATRYEFLHALYQETLYERIAAGRRIILHQRIGARLEEGHRDQAGAVAAELAMHFERGRDHERAVHYYAQAARNALRRSALQEVITLLTRALALLQTLPDTPQRNRHELTLQLALGPPLMATTGYAAPEVEHTYMRARALCEQHGDMAQLFSALRGLWVSALLRAEMYKAQEYAQQLLTLAQSAQEATLLVEAYYALGTILFFWGDLRHARVYLEQGIAAYDLHQQSSAAIVLYGQDPGVFCRLMAALALWGLGYVDQAVARIAEALMLTQKLAHSNTHAGALSFAAWVHQLRREEKATHERAEAVMSLARAQGFSFWFAWGTVMEGSWLAMHRTAAGIVQLHQGLSGVRATGAELARTYALALLAEAYGQLDRAEDGLNALTEAFAVVDKTEERFYAAELYRLKGELLLAAGSQKSKA